MRGELGLRELQRGEIIERNPPYRRLTRWDQQLPVQQPQAADVFQVGIPAVVAKKRLTERAGDGQWKPRTTGVLLVFENLERQAPVSNCGHHVPTHAELDGRLGVGEDIASFTGFGDGLA